MNGDCSRHISKGMAYTGPCKFSLLKDTEDCEGYISKRKKTMQEVKQIEKEMEEAGIER